MKKVLVLAAASLSMLSFSAIAGGNCLYGHGPEIAKAEELTEPVMSNADAVTDPRLLAYIKKQQKELDAELAPVVTYN